MTDRLEELERAMLVAEQQATELKTLAATMEPLCGSLESATALGRWNQRFTPFYLFACAGIVWHIAAELSVGGFHVFALRLSGGLFGSAFLLAGLSLIRGRKRNRRWRPPLRRRLLGLLSRSFAPPADARCHCCGVSFRIAEPHRTFYADDRFVAPLCAFCWTGLDHAIARAPYYQQAVQGLAGPHPEVQERVVSAVAAAVSAGR